MTNPNEFPTEETLQANGEQLNTYIDGLVAQGSETNPTLSNFSLTMTRLLANRIGEHGVVPMGYVMATELLCADAGATGVDGFSGEPMPKEVTGQSGLAYSVFKMEADLFARSAFGDEFADAVREVRQSVQNPDANPEDDHRTEYTLEQLEQMYQFASEAKSTHEAVTDKNGYFDILKDVPGVDPVLATIDGHPEDIPKDGWLVNSHIAPGYGGVINIYRYEGGLGIDDRYTSDTREEYGSARVGLSLDGYGSFTIAYENPAFPQKDVEPYNRMSQTSYTGHGFGQTDIISLENGGRLLADKDPLTMHGGGMSSSMDWEDIDRKKEHNGTEVDINRVTGDQKQVSEILTQLGLGMSLGEQDIATMLEAVATKTATQ
jgi:hypothetical protein